MGVFSALVIGVGGGSFVRVLRRAFPACAIDGVEIDPMVLRTFSPFPPPFLDLSRPFTSTFRCLSSTFYLFAAAPIYFHCLSSTARCLANTFPLLSLNCSLPFVDLSLTCHCLSLSTGFAEVAREYFGLAELEAEADAEADAEVASGGGGRLRLFVGNGTAFRVRCSASLKHCLSLAFPLPLDLEDSAFPCGAAADAMEFVDQRLSLLATVAAAGGEVPYHCPSLPYHFHCLSLTYHCLFTALHCLSLRITLTAYH